MSGPSGRRAVKSPPSTWTRRAAASTPHASSIALLLLLVATVGLHAAAIRLPFFADDYLFLDGVRGRGLPAALASRDPLGNFWRPLGRQGYFWLVARLGESPAAAHAINLLLFACVVASHFLLVRRLAGARAAAIAAGILAMSYAADVPVRWASGSQDLIAIAGGLGSLVLLAAGRRTAATASLVLGLLSKETVIVTPAVAAVLFRRRGEAWSRSLGRAAPLGVAAGIWAVLWVIAMHGRSGGELHFSPGAIAAAPLHLLQVATGAEWSGPFRPSWTRIVPVLVPGLIAISGIGVAWRDDTAARKAETTDRPSAGWSAGALWALLGTIPVMGVVHIWSAYYYLFALCGLSLMLGVLLARGSRAVAMAAVLAMACGSQAARTSESYSMNPGNWNTESHLNRFYFDRTMWWVNRYLEDLLRQQPRLPSHSTVFFAGVRAFVAWQVADGPLIRWAYRDSTLHSYFFREFSLDKVGRGPVFVFSVRNDSLIEQAGDLEGAMALASSQLLSERVEVARDAVRLALRTQPEAVALRYWNAWLSAAAGDSATLLIELAKAGCAARRGPSPECASARRALEARDTTAAALWLTQGVQSHALDPEVHALLADVTLSVSPQSSGGAMEAFVTRLLTPDDAPAWLRWADAQVQSGHFQEAYASLAHYFELVGPDGPGEAGRERRLLEQLRRALPGGELARLGLRDRPATRR